MSEFFKGSSLKLLALFFLIGVIIYSNSLSNPFIWDDSSLVVDNELIKDWKHTGKIFSSDVTHGQDRQSRHYRPVQTFLYAAIYHAFGLNPFWYHLVNIIIFCLNAYLVYFLVLLISRDRLVSFLTSIFFIVHPIYTSSVTYISGLADPLMGLFVFISLILFIKYPEYKGTKKNILYLISSVSFVLALLSKEVAIVLPLIFLLYDLIFDRMQLNSARNIIKRYIAFILIDLIYIYLRFTVLALSDIPPQTAQFSFYSRFLIFANVINSYFSLLFLPFNLHMLRAYYVPQTVFDMPTLFSLASLAIVSVFVVYSYKRSKIIFFFSIWFCIFLLAQSSLFIPINTFMAEHFLYLPAICFFVIVAVGLARFCPKKILALVVFAIIGFYSFLTFSRNYEWRNPILFYERILELSPRSWAAYNNLGKLYLEKKEYRRALYYLGESLRLNNKQLQARDNLVKLYQERGDYDAAITQYREMLGVASGYKEGQMHNNIGFIYQKMGKYDMAIKEYNLAIEIDPDLILPYYNLAFVYFNKGSTEDMIENIEKSLRIAYLPKDLSRGARPTKKEYRVALDFVNHRDYLIYIKLGILYAGYDLFDAAQRAFQIAIKLEPGFSDSYYNLGVLYWHKGNSRQATRLWREALKINPDHTLAQAWLKKVNK